MLNADGLALFLRHFAASVPAAYEMTDANGTKFKPHDIAPADMLFDRSRAENRDDAKRCHTCGSHRSQGERQ